MKKLLTFFLSTLLITSCDYFKGSISGNVFYKYNDYVGNKPDAGSTILLYPVKKGAEPIRTTADVQGNFSFEKIPTGEYLLIAKSANINQSKRDYFDEVYYKLYALDKIFSFNFSEDERKQFELVEQYKDYSYSILTNHDLEVYYKVEDTLEMKARNALDVFLNKGSFYQWYSIGKKSKIEKITVQRNKTTNVVIDFGITYY